MTHSRNNKDRLFTHGAWCVAFCLAVQMLVAVNPQSVAATRDDFNRALSLSAGGELDAALALLDLEFASLSEQTTAFDIDVRLLRVDVLRGLGSMVRADHELGLLDTFLRSAPAALPEQVAQADRQRALLYYYQGENGPAAAAIARALERQAQLPADLQAQLLNDAALIRQRSGDFEAAISGFEAAAERAQAGDAAITYRINAARAMLDDGRVEQALQAASGVTRSLASFPQGSAAGERIALANLYRRAVNSFDAPASYRLDALRQLQQAGAAASLPPRLRSLVEGYTAQLYLDDRQYQTAVQYGRIALQQADQAEIEDLVYRWEWVMARAFARLGETEPSIAAYARAIASLRSLRGNLETQDPATFSSVIQPLYYEYADALLTQSSVDRDAG
ncbi:MAG: hypothetical protein ACK5HY_15010, partial [Parahaliea sp.]